LFNTHFLSLRKRTDTSAREWKKVCQVQKEIRVVRQSDTTIFPTILAIPLNDVSIGESKGGALKALEFAGNPK